MTDTGLPEWHVVGAGIRQEETLADSGNGLQRMYVIPYVIDSGPAKGHQGVVRVTPEEFTPVRVQQAVESVISAAHLVADLGNKHDHVA